MATMTPGTPPQPEDKPAPDPSITVEEFREQFTEDMRHELWDALNALRKERVSELRALAHSKDQAEIIANRQMFTGMRALQLIHALHAQPYTKIG